MIRRIIIALMLALIVPTAKASEASFSDLQSSVWTEITSGNFELFWSDIGVTPPSSDLILEYLFGAYGGNEATLCEDTSGNNYTGTVVGATWNTATNGLTDLYDFDGANDKIRFPDAIIGSSQAVTYNLWVKGDGGSAEGRILGTGFTTYTSLRADKSGVDNDLYLEVNGWYDAVNMDLDKWNNIVIVKVNGNALTRTNIWYVNGYRQGGGLGIGWVAATPFENHLASDRSGTATFYGGEIARFEVTTNALTPAQILATNRTQAVDLGIYPAYLTASQSSNVVFAMNYSGETEQDASTNSATVTGNNTTAVDLGTVNGAIDLIGSSSSSSTPNSLALSSSNLTFSTWFNSDITLTSGAGIHAFASKTASGTDSWMILYVTAGEVVSKFFASAESRLAYAVNFASGIWYHLAVTCDASGQVLYLDGQPVSTNAVSSGILTTNTASLTVGALQHTAGYFNGAVDENIVLNRALTANEVSQNLYTNSWHLFGQIEGITTNSWWSSVQAFYTFNVESSQDYSGNGNHGTDTDVTYDGSSAIFNGSSSRIVIGDVAGLDLTGNMSMGAFVNPDTIADNERIIDKGDAYWMGVSNSLWKVVYGTLEVNAGTATTSEWTGVYANFDGTTLTLYTNGVSAGTTTTGSAPSANATDLTIGSSGAGDWLDGSLDSVIIADTVMSASDMNNLGHGGQ